MDEQNRFGFTGPATSTRTAGAPGTHDNPGWFVVRVPLLPFDALLSWRDQVGRLPDPVPPAALSRPDVLEAIFLAAPRLASYLEAGNAEPPRGKADRALLRYFLRMVGQPTPFGLFATWSMGRIADHTRLDVGSASTVRRRTRLDSGYVAGLVQALSDDPGVRSRLLLRPNPTIRRVGDRLRFVEFRLAKNGVARHYMSDVGASEALTGLLQHLANGDATPGELVRALADAGHSRWEASAFVDDLIDCQFLLTDLEPTSTDGDAVDHLVRKLPTANTDGRSLAAAAALLAALDARSIGRPPAEYLDVAARLSRPGPAVDSAGLFHVDAFRPDQGASIGPAVVDAIRHGVAVLHRAGSPWRDAGLDRFRAAFVERYDQQEVPLLEALDEESGIGYLPVSSSAAEPSALLDSIPAAVRGEGRDRTWEARDEHLVALLHRAWTDGGGQIDLDEADLAALATPGQPPLADAFAVLCSVSSTAGADQPAVFVDSVVGPSGVRMIGRICDLDLSLERAVRAHLAAEERLSPNAVFAEIVHCPPGRLGNVVRRPSLRGWEIPVVQRSGLPSSRQLSLADLTVTVADNRIRLFSASLGREVLPRMSNAHDFHTGTIALYEFLCALQSEGSAGTVRWSWGTLDHAPFLPRVRSGPAVISLARWNLSGQEVSNLFGPDGDLQWPALNELRSRRRLPRFMRLADGPGGLILDLDNPLATAAAIPAIRGRRSAALEEMWPDYHHLAARGPEGRYVHQLIVPFERVATTPNPAPPTTATPPRVPAPSARDAYPRFRRSFPPGSDWLSVKVYSGAAHADRLLTGPIAEVINGCADSGELDAWFFIRYADPVPHLRIRFRGSAARAGSTMRWREHLERVLNREFDRGGIQSISYDTYRREVERYGGPAGILVAEEMFQADSRAALEILPVVRGDDNETRRWVTALVGVDRLLDGLGLDLPQRHQVVGHLRRSLESEFRIGSTERAAILTRQRPIRSQLLRLLAGDSVPDLMSTHTQDCFERRSRNLRSHGDTLWLLARDGELSTTVESIAGALAHLSVNRLLRSAHRRYELVLCSLLDRLYDSIEARLRTRR